MNESVHHPAPRVEEVPIIFIVRLATCMYIAKQIQRIFKGLRLLYYTATFLSDHRTAQHFLHAPLATLGEGGGVEVTTVGFMQICVHSSVCIINFTH